MDQYAVLDAAKTKAMAELTDSEKQRG